jgi:hypothetical protein
MHGAISPLPNTLSGRGAQLHKSAVTHSPFTLDILQSYKVPNHGINVTRNIYKRKLEYSVRNGNQQIKVIVGAAFFHVC